MPKQPYKPLRISTFRRTAKAGCQTCNIKWTTIQASAMAAKHFDRFGHETWVNTFVTIKYHRKGAKVEI
jgi:hypothetical protein